MKIVGVVAAAIAALLIVTQGASAQYWQSPQWPQQQAPQQRERPHQNFGGGGGANAGACVPSGFARLSRNCSVNTGGCQRMPDNCNRGWCCP